MLKLTIVLSESWDSVNEEFLYEKIDLELEHSLVSLSKWESIHEKLFLGKDEKTKEEIYSYIECMICTPDYPPNVVEKFTEEDFEKINAYIDAKMTATYFSQTKNAPRPREQISSELIYYWLVSYQIPWEAQYWHLNRLFTLIRVFNVKNTQEKPKTNREMMEERRALNAKRLKELKTTG